MNNYQDVWQKIDDLLSDVKDLSPGTLQETTPLRTLELDSLDYVEMMVAVKRDFGITLEAEMFTSNPDITLGELCQIISKQAQ